MSPLQRAGRLVCIAAILGIGAWSIDGVMVLMRGFSTDKKPFDPEAYATVPTIAESLASIPEQGNWLLNGLPWQVSASFLSVGSQKPIIDANDLHEPLAHGARHPIEIQFLKMLRQVARPASSSSGITHYSLTTSGMQLAAATYHAQESERLAWLRLQLELDDTRSLLVEARPREEQYLANTGERERLLPMPNSCTPIASYVAADGATQLQIVSTVESRASLAARWRSAGWNVIVNATDESAFDSVTCCRRHEAFLAVFWESNGKDEAFLLIVRAGGAGARIGAGPNK